MVRLLTKKALCHAFGLRTKSGACYYHTLRSSYFTDRILKDLDIDRDRYKAIKGKSTFSYDESVRIVKYFDIKPDELD